MTLLENNNDLDGIPVARSLLVDIMSALPLPLMEQDWVERSLLVVKLLKSIVPPPMPAKPERLLLAIVGWPRSEVATFSFLPCFSLLSPLLLFSGPDNRFDVSREFLAQVSARY